MAVKRGFWDYLCESMGKKTKNCGKDRLSELTLRVKSQNVIAFDPTGYYRIGQWFRQEILSLDKKMIGKNEK